MRFPGGKYIFFTRYAFISCTKRNCDDADVNIFVLTQLVATFFRKKYALFIVGMNRRIN